MTALQMQTQFNDAYARALDAPKLSREAFDQLTTMHMALNRQRTEEGLEPLQLPNLWRTYNALRGYKAKIGDRVIYLIGCDCHTAYVIDVFENGDIRTDRDGVRTKDEYTVINK